MEAGSVYKKKRGAGQNLFSGFLKTRKEVVKTNERKNLDR